jgi:hypothetical protein
MSEEWSGRLGSNSRPLPWQGSLLILSSGGGRKWLLNEYLPQFPRGSTLSPRRSTLTTPASTLAQLKQFLGEKAKPSDSAFKNLHLRLVVVTSGRCGERRHRRRLRRGRRRARAPPLWAS